MNVSVNKTMLCSWEIAASSFNHSSNSTAHRAKSRVRLLLVIVAAAFADELDIASIDEYVELSFDNESYDMGPDDGDASRTVAFDEPEIMPTNSLDEIESGTKNSTSLHFMCEEKWITTITCQQKNWAVSRKRQCFIMDEGLWKPQNELKFELWALDFRIRHFWIVISGKSWPFRVFCGHSQNYIKLSVMRFGGFGLLGVSHQKWPERSELFDSSCSFWPGTLRSKIL